MTLDLTILNDFYGESLRKGGLTATQARTSLKAKCGGCRFKPRGIANKMVELRFKRFR